MLTTNIYTTKYNNNRDNLKMGEKAELKFIDVAIKFGWDLTQSALEEDKRKHWDYIISKDGKEYKVDVKAMKRLAKHVGEPQDEWIWIELQGWGNPGWLYGGIADLIAFEMKYGFLIVKREDIKKIILEKVDLYTKVANAEDAKYKLHKRNTGDISTMVRAEDLEEVVWERWIYGNTDNNSEKIFLDKNRKQMQTDSRI